MVLLLSPFLAISSEIQVDAAVENSLGGEKSYKHRGQVPSIYDGSISPNASGQDRWLLASYKSARTNWHNFIPGGYDASSSKIGAIGLENPNSYSPPSGWEVQGILKYPVYTPRHYAISIRDCGGTVNQGDCHPHKFEPSRPQNQWAIRDISYDSWTYDKKEDTWEGKVGPFFIFDAAQRLYAYDIRIVKKGGTPPIDPPVDPGDGGETEPPPNPCDSGGCDPVVLTCPPPDRPAELNTPFEYKLDLVTERIEGQTVEKGTVTETPVTVYRADYSGEREAIKNKLNQSIATNNSLKSDCQSKISEMESNLSILQGKLSEIQAALSACQSSVPPTDCSNVQSGLGQVNSSIGLQSSAISSAQSALPLYDAVIQEILNYLQTILDAENRYRIINTFVDLTFRDKATNSITFIDRTAVPIQENERKLLTYHWILQSDGYVKAFIDPDNEYTACPKPGGACETNESNNIKETPIYIASHETVLACAREGQNSQLTGITRTVTSASGTQTYRETANATLSIDPQEKKRRAGYGFYYKVNTDYINEDIAPNRSSIGTTIASPFKPELLANHLPYTFQSWYAPYSFTHGITQSNLQMNGYKIPSMNVKNTNEQNQSGLAYKQVKEWELPSYSIESYSGNIFEGDIKTAAINPKHNPSDKLLDGGHKWYLDFLQPDGQFVYDVLIPDIGVNKLNLCVTGEVEVTGTFTGDENGNSDFIFRSIDTTNAFPSGTGWNWKNYTNVISGISDWWTEWYYPNPAEVPESYHEEHYELENSTKKQIRDENENKSTSEIYLGNDFMNRYGF